MPDGSVTALSPRLLSQLLFALLVSVPHGPGAKMLMLVQSAVSLTLAVMVVARAVTILR
jgi:hypothetical protein